MDPKVKLKKQYLDDMHSSRRAFRGQFQTLSGHDWYRQQAARAVNQAIGRVIRHRRDYGAILLCDERFGTPSSINQLPVWKQFGEGLGQLTKFFRSMEGFQTKQPPPPDVTPGKEIVTGHAAILKHKEFRSLVKKEGSSRELTLAAPEGSVALRAKRQREGVGGTKWAELTGTTDTTVTKAGASRPVGFTDGSKRTVTTAVARLTTVERMSSGGSASSMSEGEGRKRPPEGEGGLERRKRVSNRGGEGVGDGTDVTRKDGKAGGRRRGEKAYGFLDMVQEFLPPRSYEKFQIILRAKRDEKVSMDEVIEEVVRIFIDTARNGSASSASESDSSGDGSNGRGVDNDSESRMKNAMELLKHFSGFVPTRRKADFARRLEGIEADLRKRGELP
ncbi:Regulator of telomere elongation helicase 1 [Rhizophlyctis rosea]|uniref:Regulator of telomere elongation helicase 1 n=1 Tax=Rhizophlyctis rosea TaxID=64517 RepID=A0AAD5SGS7_9FUNG|nr:Regulator of telomere elongation helicase 1 [Rhizophlyctis rosea]